MKKKIKIPKYDQGGKVKPKYVTDPNDPALKAYQDSLTLYNGTIGDIERLAKLSSLIPDRTVFGNTYYDWVKENQKTNRFKKGLKAYKSLTKLNGEKPTPEKTLTIDTNYAEEYKKPTQPVILQKRKDIPLMKSIPLNNEQIDLQPKQYQAPETYMMPDGNKYNYNELLQAYPDMKNNKTFKRNFPKYKMNNGGQVPPVLINTEKDELLVSPNTDILKTYTNFPEHPESGVNPKGNTIEQPGNFVIPKKLAKLYKEGDRLRRQTMLMNLQNKQAATNKMEEGGKVNYGMLASSIGGGINNLGANRSAKAQSPDYGQNMYSTDYSRNMQMGNQIGDGIGAAIPIAGAFKGLGQGSANLVAPSDQYGVRKGSTAQVGIASAIDPLPVTAEAVSNISQGKELGQSAYAFINPIKAGVDMNNRNKANRDRLEVWSKGNEELDNLQNRSYNNDTIKFGKGGKIPKYGDKGLITDPDAPESMGNIYGDKMINQLQKEQATNKPYDWNMLATGLNDAFLNTMGPASYLREQGKNYDTVKYPDANPNLINDNEQLREADLQNAAYNKDIMSASGGNSGTYLANRLAGLTRNLMNKNRIRENTANTNTQIKNQFNLYNNASKARAIDATAANKGQSLTNYYSAMGNMGKNLAGTSQTIDGRDHQMDLYKVMLQMFLV